MHMEASYMRVKNKDSYTLHDASWPFVSTSISCSCSWLVVYVSWSLSSNSWFLSRRFLPSSAAKWRSVHRKTVSYNTTKIQEHVSVESWYKAIMATRLFRLNGVHITSHQMLPWRQEDLLIRKYFSTLWNIFKSFLVIQWFSFST